MATDRNGNTIALGDDLVVIAPARRVSGSRVSVVLNDGTPLHVTDSETLKATELGGGDFLPLAGGTLTGALDIQCGSLVQGLRVTENALNTMAIGMVHGLNPGAGLYRDGNDSSSLRLYSGTFEGVRITAAGNSYIRNGNLGIGTSNPLYSVDVAGSLRATGDVHLTGSNVYVGYQLVHSGDTDTAIRLTTDTITLQAGGSSNQFVCSSNSGRVGIGTASPSGKLHVADGTQTWIYVEDTTASNTVGIQFRTGGNTQQAFQLDTANNLVFRNTAGTHSGSIFFDAKNGVRWRVTSSQTEVMRLTSAGRLGINTTSPATDFEVQSSALDQNFVQFSNPSGQALFRFAVNASGYGRWEVRDASNTKVADLSTAAGTANFAFLGYVGAGTLSPSAALHGKVGSSGNVPALHLEQSDDGEKVLKITATEGAGKPVLTSTAQGLLARQIAVDINGTTYYVPAYAAPA